MGPHLGPKRSQKQKPDAHQKHRSTVETRMSQAAISLPEDSAGASEEASLDSDEEASLSSDGEAEGRDASPSSADEAAQQSDTAASSSSEDEAVQRRLAAYERSRLRYFYAVVECDSVSTGSHLYRECDGLEFERSANKCEPSLLQKWLSAVYPSMMSAQLTVRNAPYRQSRHEANERKQDSYLRHATSVVVREQHQNPDNLQEPQLLPQVQDKFY